jgi:hypothetical protein
MGTFREVVCYTSHYQQVDRGHFLLAVAKKKFFFLTLACESRDKKKPNRF